MITRGWMVSGLALGVAAFGCAVGEAPSDSIGPGDDVAVDETWGIGEKGVPFRIGNGLPARVGNGLTAVRQGLIEQLKLRTRTASTTLYGLNTRNAAEIDDMEPDGILSNGLDGRQPGLMSEAYNRGDVTRFGGSPGVEIAKYIVKCALPAGDYIRVLPWNSNDYVQLRGFVGVAAGWKLGRCDTTCQERVSACLIALTNGHGESIDVELSATFKVLGTTGRQYPYQELVAFGNLFVSPPKAFVASGRSYPGHAALVRMGTYVPGQHCGRYEGARHSCNSVTTTHLEVPYTHVGGAYSVATGSEPRADYIATTSDPDNTLYTVRKERGVCEQVDVHDGAGTAKRCSWRGRSWENPVTVGRSVPYNGPSIRGS